MGGKPYTQEELIIVTKMYNEGKTAQEIAAQLGITLYGVYHRIRKIRKRRACPLISASKHQSMISSKQTLSKETRRKISVALKGEKSWLYGRYGDKHPMYGRTGDKHPQYGTPTPFHAKKWRDGGIKQLGHPVRSSWELEFGKFLQKEGLIYAYEDATFPIKINGKPYTYTPDFYIIRYDVYVELKGYDWSGLDYKKIEAVKEQYGEVIVIIDESNYKTWLKNIKEL